MPSGVGVPDLRTVGVLAVLPKTQASFGVKLCRYLRYLRHVRFGAKVVLSAVANARQVQIRQCDTALDHRLPILSKDGLRRTDVACSMLGRDHSTLIARDSLISVGDLPNRARIVRAKCDASVNPARRPISELVTRR